MDADERKQIVNDTLLAKLRDALDLELVEGLPQPCYNFNPDGWMLFRVRGNPHVGASEYVAVRREAGEVRFLGQLGE
jgi:hypothetical protein